MLLSAALLAGALVAAGPSQAAKKKPRSPAIKTVSAADTTTVHTQLLSVVATCPKRTTLVGGGFRSGLLTTAASLDVHLVYESRRLSPRQWIVSGGRADADSSGNPLALTSYAQCRVGKKPKKKGARGSAGDAAAVQKKRKKFEVTESAAAVPLLSGFLPSAATTASCQGRTRAIGGGFSLTPPPFGVNPNIDFALSFESRRTSAKGWTVSATQFSPTQRTLAAFAYCAPGKAPKARSSTVFLAGNALSTAAASSPPCPRRLRLASGGYLAQVPSQGGSAAQFVSSAPAGTSWHILATQGLEGSGGNVITYGYCL